MSGITIEPIKPVYAATGQRHLLFRCDPRVAHASTAKASQHTVSARLSSRDSTERTPHVTVQLNAAD